MLCIIWISMVIFWKAICRNSKLGMKLQVYHACLFQTLIVFYQLITASVQQFSHCLPIHCSHTGICHFNKSFTLSPICSPTPHFQQLNCPCPWLGVIQSQLCSSMQSCEIRPVFGSKNLCSFNLFCNYQKARYRYCFSGDIVNSFSVACTNIQERL